MRIVVDDLSGPEIADLIAFHLRGMHADSPPGHSFALGVEALKTPDITVWSAWGGASIMGCGALRDLGDGTGEIKSMRTAPQHLRKGVGAALLEAIISEAHARGYHRLSLETGSGPAFEAALGLYRNRGFVPGAAFGSYSASAFNQFFHLDLD